MSQSREGGEFPEFGESPEFLRGTGSLFEYFEDTLPGYKVLVPPEVDLVLDRFRFHRLRIDYYPVRWEFVLLDISGLSLLGGVVCVEED